MITRIATNLEYIENLQAEWTSLLARANLNNLFLTWEWVYSWRQHMMSKSETPFIITARKSNRLIGLAPVVLVRHRILGSHLEFIGQAYSYHLGFIAEKGSEKSIYEALWVHILNQNTWKWRFIEFLHMEEDAVFESVLRKQADKRGLILCRSTQNTCKVLDLSDSYDDYLRSGIPSHNLRRNLIKDSRRLKRESAMDFHCADKRSFSKYWAELLRLHQQHILSKGGHSVLIGTPFPHHLYQIAEIFQEKQALRLSVLTINDQTAAIILGIIYNRVFNALTIGLNPQLIQASPWLNLCVLTHVLCVRDAIENRCSQFDFLGGHHEYKYKMGGKDRAGFKIKIYPSKAANLQERCLLRLNSFIYAVRHANNSSINEEKNHSRA